MSGEQRRSAILAALSDAAQPVSGTALARRFGVSRQVIVQDIALLRSSGTRINATNRGYVCEKDDAPRDGRPHRLFKVRHSVADTADELTLIVDRGGCVEDVAVNHRAYGKISASLGVESRRDVAAYLHDIETGKSSPLMTVTSGYHFHHVSAPSEEALDEIERALGDRGYLAEVLPYEREEFDA